MPKTSAGLLPFRRVGAVVEVFIAHMGGPLWARRDAGGWSIVKGEYEPGVEEPIEVATREFVEEIGVPAPAGEWLPLGEFRQKIGKVVTVFAVEIPEGGPALEFVQSNTFTMQWPPGSGRMQQFPEVDRAEWVDLETARVKLVSGQTPALEALIGHVSQL